MKSKKSPRPQAWVDLDRANFRAEAFSGYGVTSALLLSTALHLFEKEYDFHGEDEFIRIIFYGTCIICIVTSMTATFVFSLLGLYSSSAIGIGNDFGYLRFLENSKETRVIGFQSMVVSLFCLQASFVIYTYLRFRGTFRILFATIAFVTTVISYQTWTKILRLASQFLFQWWSSRKYRYIHFFMSCPKHSQL